MIYITRLKKQTVPEPKVGVNTNLINELFGDPIVEQAVENISRYVRTSTTTIDETAQPTLSTNQISSIGIITKELSTFLDKIHPYDCYTTFKIPKKTGGMRTIEAPNAELKDMQKHIANYLYYNLQVLPHDSAYAYVKGRSILDAVNEHKINKSQWFLKIDLKDFFGSCSDKFIRETLPTIFPFNKELLKDFNEDLIRLATLEYKLPQGTPLSPILTNILMVPYDYKINQMLNSLVTTGRLAKQRYVYTRYADDILISAKTKFDYVFIINSLKEIVFKDTPFVIKDEKTRFGSASGRNWNLGLMLNKDNNITIGYKKKKDIKSMLYYYIKFGEDYDLEQLQQILGNISWLNNIEPVYCEGMLSYFKSKFNVDVISNLLQQIKSYN